MSAEGPAAEANHPSAAKSGNPPLAENEDDRLAFEPLSAAVLAELEIARRDGLKSRGGGVCRTGCAELDRHVLLAGGFERGTVVGISSEDDSFSLLVFAYSVDTCHVAGHSS